MGQSLFNAVFVYKFEGYVNIFNDFCNTEAVEFQMSFDRRTGKPVAVGVVKVDPTVVSPEILSDEKVQGTIVQEAKQIKQKNVSLVFFVFFFVFC